MHNRNIEYWEHDHIFGQNRIRAGERSTVIVIILTASMMIVEITAGIMYGSMALLADGLHMASHAVALGINAFAYIYARRHAHDPRYSFGTGKINALGGFTGAILLALFAVLMVWESVNRLFQPVEIVFNQAIIVAVIGLIINGICVFILGAGEKFDDRQQLHSHQHDHNLKSAYLHVMTDALTSVLAIVALIISKYTDFIWIDPVIGIVGAILITRWSIGLLRATSFVLLDRQGSEDLRQKIRKCIETDNDSRIADLHLWSIGPEIYAVIMTIVAHSPASAAVYKSRIPKDIGIAHISIEVQKCAENPG